MRVMSVQEAVQRVFEECERRPRLRIVGVSGPGEPLYNPATLELFSLVRESRPDLEFCLSTNGILLTENVGALVALGVRTVTVSIHAVTPEYADRVYEWAIIDGRRKVRQVGADVVRRQLDGLRAAARAGIHVKVNTVLIPDVNESEVTLVAQTVAQAGAEIQNVMPLVPPAGGEGLMAPSGAALLSVRRSASHYIPQFLHCSQCRSDVVGVPGVDIPLWLAD